MLQLLVAAKDATRKLPVVGAHRRAGRIAGARPPSARLWYTR